MIQEGFKKLNIKLINNIDLYKPDEENCLRSLEYAKKLNTDKKIIFHCFWRVSDLDFSRKQLACLKSIIVNHIENLHNLEINLWSNVDLSNNEYFREVNKYVTLKKWNVQEEVKGTILENNPNMFNIDDSRNYLEGDLFRLLILHKYGGFYIDMDVLVLRNMFSLNNLEFLYQWGKSGFNSDEPIILMNGAVMRLEKKSALSIEFLEKLSITEPVKNSTSWGSQLYSNIEYNDLLVLPGVWFNSEWSFENTKLDPFKNIGTPDLFDGAFTWHWHNQWNSEIEIGSKFQVLEELHNNIFSKINSYNKSPIFISYVLPNNLSSNMDLEDIAKQHGTDKVTHGYIKFYEEAFETIRNNEIKLLEIGVYRGASIRTWEDYFANGLIFGIDNCTIIDKESLLGFTQGRIKTFITDQKDRRELHEVILQIESLDIIIDDGLHYQEHQQVSFGFLFKFLKNNGLYVIEDLCPREYKLGTWGIREMKEITTNVLEEFNVSGKIISPYITDEEKLYLEEHIESIKIHYISEQSIIAFIQKK
jgi:hypothetical protein